MLPLLCSTPHVVTLWYRPPELLCGNTTYGSSIDMWSCGIVMAELLGRSPPFCADNHMRMLRKIIAQLGTPSDDELSKMIEDPRALNFIQNKISHAEPRAWSERYPSAPAAMLSLLADLLSFDPCRRPHAAAALRHAWLEELHDEEDLREPNCGEGPPLRCEFPFEECNVNLDHFLLAGLEAAREAHPDYPLEVPEMARFGVEHGRAEAVLRMAGTGGDADGAARGFHEWED